MKKLILSGMFILAIGAGCVSAQTIERSVIASTGGSNVTGGIDVNYTVGDLVVVTGTSGNVVVTQGFQQANMDSTVSVNTPKPETNITVFPNPVANEVFVRGTLSGAEHASLEVWDAAGRLVARKEFSLHDGQVDEKVDLSGLSAGRYHLSLFDGNNLRGSFKVQKIQ